MLNTPDQAHTLVVGLAAPFVICHSLPIMLKSLGKKKAPALCLKPEAVAKTVGAAPADTF
jgi:hypothetical protein